jgi:hypothetical protein
MLVRTLSSWQQPLRPIGDAIEGVAHDREIGAASLGDQQPLVLAIEQLQSELDLERFHLMADRALGDAELPRRRFERRQTGRGIGGERHEKN